MYSVTTYIHHHIEGSYQYHKDKNKTKGKIKIGQKEGKKEARQKREGGKKKGRKKERKCSRVENEEIKLTLSSYDNTFKKLKVYTA